MNYMKQVAEMLGVELEEEFEVIEPNSKVISKLKYYFIEEGLYSDTIEVGRCYPLILDELLIGKMEVYKKSYKDDFLEKFPNSSLKNNDTESLCVDDVYGTGLCCSKVDYSCNNCWNRAFK